MRYVTTNKNLAFTVMTGSGVKTIKFQRGGFPAHGGDDIVDQELIHAIESHRLFGKKFHRVGDQIVNRAGMTASEMDAIKERARRAMAEVGQPAPAELPPDEPTIPSPTEIQKLKKSETVELMKDLGIECDPSLRIQSLKKQLRTWIEENS